MIAQKIVNVGTGLLVTRSSRVAQTSESRTLETLAARHPGFMEWQKTPQNRHGLQVILARSGAHFVPTPDTMGRDSKHPSGLPPPSLPVGVVERRDDRTFRSGGVEEILLAHEDPYMIDGLCRVEENQISYSHVRTVYLRAEHGLSLRIARKFDAKLVSESQLHESRAIDSTSALPTEDVLYAFPGIRLRLQERPSLLLRLWLPRRLGRTGICRRRPRTRHRKERNECREYIFTRERPPREPVHSVSW